MIRVTVYPGASGWFVDFQDGEVSRTAGPMRRAEALALGDEAEATWDAVLTVIEDAA